MPEKVVKDIDKWVAEGKSASRSEAVKTIVALYQKRKRTRQFYEMLQKRSKEAQEKPGILVPLDEVQ